MAKTAAGRPMTKSEIAAMLAEKVGISKKQAKNQFAVPGIGKLVLTERPAREMVMRFGPKAGQTVKIPKKKVLKFRVAKAAKDAILRAK